MKRLTFEVNGLSSIELIAGQYALLYFVLRYDGIPEYFYLSPSQVPKALLRKADNTVVEFVGTIAAAMPGVFYIVLTPADTAALNIGTDQSIELEVFDASGNKCIAQRTKALTVKPRLFS